MLHLLLQNLKTQAVSLTCASADQGTPLSVTGILWDIFNFDGKFVALLVETMRETKPNIVPLHAQTNAVGRTAPEHIQNFYFNFVDVQKVLSVRVIAGFHIDETKRTLVPWPKMEIYKDSDDAESTQAWREGITRKIEKQLQAWGMREAPTEDPLIDILPNVEV